MQNRKPSVSVIVTTFNRKELLKETLDSILNQTFKDFELIVVDNYSNYDFYKYIKGFNDDRIKPFQNQNNGIIAINRNFGVKKAKGKYLAFCDDDDLWMNNKLEKQLTILKYDENIVGLGSRVIKFDGGKSWKNKNKNRNLKLSFKQLFYDTAPLSSLIVLNKGLFFDESEEYLGVEDADYQLQLAFHSNQTLMILSEPLIFYRIHNQNESKKKIEKNNFFNVLEKYKNELSHKEFNRKKAHLHFSRALLFVRYNENNIVYHLKKSLLFGNLRIKTLSFFLLILHFFPKKIKASIIKPNGLRT
jgi:teichuronic acid biosynthesis glycosyltransferase TuaG